MNHHDSDHDRTLELRAILRMVEQRAREHAYAAEVHRRGLRDGEHGRTAAEIGQAADMLERERQHAHRQGIPSDRIGGAMVRGIYDGNVAARAAATPDTRDLPAT